jgi:hypothetical protein
MAKKFEWKTYKDLKFEYQIYVGLLFAMALILLLGGMILLATMSKDIAPTEFNPEGRSKILPGNVVGGLVCFGLTALAIYGGYSLMTDIKNAKTCNANFWTTTTCVKFPTVTADNEGATERAVSLCTAQTKAQYNGSSGFYAKSNTSVSGTLDVMYITIEGESKAITLSTGTSNLYTVRTGDKKVKVTGGGTGCLSVSGNVGGGGGPSPGGGESSPTQDNVCVGEWSACSATCIEPDQPAPRSTFVITNPGSPGSVCKDSSGTIIVSGVNDSKICSNLPGCGRHCKGTWSGWSPCSSDCGRSTKRRTFTHDTNGDPTPGGKACTVDYGPFAVGNNAIEEQTCVIGDTGYSKAVCDVALDCQGDWFDTNCTKTCGGGFMQQEYRYINNYPQTDARGNSGKACKDANGVIRTSGDQRITAKACNSTNCCDSVTMNQWVKVGQDCMTGLTSDLPVVTWTRAVNSTPQELVGKNINIECGYPVVATSYSSRQISAIQGECAPRVPISGKCTNDGTYSTSTGCTSKQPVKATNISCRDEQGSTFDTDSSKRDLAVKLRRKVISDEALTGADTDYSLIYDAKSNAPLDTTIDGCRVDIILQKPGMTSININKMTIQETVSSATCPNGYTRNGAKCTFPVSTISDIQCPTLFQSKNLSSNRCESSTAAGSGQVLANDDRPTMVSSGIQATNSELGII